MKKNMQESENLKMGPKFLLEMNDSNCATNLWQDISVTMGKSLFNLRPSKLQRQYQVSYKIFFDALSGLVSVGGAKAQPRR